MSPSESRHSLFPFALPPSAQALCLFSLSVIAQAMTARNTPGRRCLVLRRRLDRDLVAAVRKGDASGVESLLKRKANPNARMRDGATALCVAVSTRQSVLVRILLAAKADPNIADKSDEPVLAKALNPRSVDIAEMLLAAGADPNRHDQNGWLPLSRAALSGSLALVDLLINAGADVNLRDIDGTTPLRSATRAGHSHIAQRFWEAATNGAES